MKLCGAVIGKVDLSELYGTTGTYCQFECGQEISANFQIEKHIWYIIIIIQKHMQ